MYPALLNFHDGNIPPSAVYIGRKTKLLDSDFGNPYHIGEDGSREDVIYKHWRDLHRDPKLFAKVRRELFGKQLVCYCTPKSCHGDTLLRVANAPGMVPSFRGDYEFLSNFYASPIRTASGLVYPSSEHAYQAMKTTSSSTRRFMATISPVGRVKKFGQTVAVRDCWDDLKLRAMYKVLKAKFSQNLNLAMALIDTCDAVLVEGNYWGDRFWGVCDGTGDNNLGLILMRVRSELFSKFIIGG